MPTGLTSDGVSLDSLVAGVVDDFRERQKRGDKPDVEEYATRHPEAADLLRKVLAAFQLVDGSPSSSPLPLYSGGERPGVRGAPASAPDDVPLSGTLGDFRLIREVGRGGMGIVYEAEQISLGRRVALKVLPFAATLDPRQLQRFHNEARAAASLRHEHIVPVFAVGQERGIHFFAMQFVDGQTVADLIRQQKGGATPAASDAPTTGPGQSPAPSADTEPLAAKTTEPIPRDAVYFRRAAEWGIQAAEALEHAHSLGIVHRDIKPGNLMIDAHGQLWVTDFGLARRAAESDLTMSGDLLGTLRYMSPEQALAKHDLVDHRSDVYSLGATLYELLTLRPAAEGKDRQEIIQHITQADATSLRRHDRRIPADLETIVLKALAKEPEGRYATAKELAEDLRRSLASEPIRARRPSLRQRLAKWGRRNRPAVIAATVATFVITSVLGAAAGFAYQAEQDRAEREQDKLQAQRDQLTKDMNRLLDDAENRRQEIHAKLADPIKASQIVSKIDDWKGKLAQARAALGQAKTLAAKNEDLLTADLSARVQKLDEQLLLDEKEWQIAKELDDMRLGSTTLVNGVWAPGQVGKGFDKVFRGLGIDFANNRPAKHAQVIERSNLRFVLVAALDYWATMTDDRSRVGTLLATARLADPDPWRDQVRTEGNWTKPEVLRDLAEKAELSRHSPHVAELLVHCLLKNKIDPTLLIRTSLMCHPQDFLLHIEACEHSRTFDARVAHYYGALAIRGDSSPIHNNLAHALMKVRDLDGAIGHFRRALECDPLNILAHLGLSQALWQVKDVEGAAKHFQLGSDLANKYASTRDVFECQHIHFYAGVVAEQQKKPERAIPHYRKVLELDPRHVQADRNMARLTKDGKRLFELSKENAHARVDDFPTSMRRTETAKTAILASGGQDDKITEADRRSMRKLALDEMRANLDFWREYSRKNRPSALIDVGLLLLSCQKTPDFAEVREEKHVAMLPEPERVSWQTLWADLEEVRKEGQDRFKGISRVSGMISGTPGELMHKETLQAGKTYVVDVETSAFRLYPVLRDARGKIYRHQSVHTTLGMPRLMCLIFAPSKDGTYWVLGPESLENTGPYTLTIREFVK
ncbi:MAG: protein kinase [Gemmataceae bacterium]